MPRAPNPLTKKAEKLYRDGMKLARIAEKLGVPAGTVRRWKVECGWENERSESERLESERPAQKPRAAKRRGAPEGNKNAVGNVGGGAPFGNTNALKHGFFYNALLPEEREMMDSKSALSEEERLESAVALWEFKIRRLLLELREIRGGAAMVVKSVTKDGKGASSTAVNRFEREESLEKLLNAAQNGHMRCIQALSRLRLERQKQGDGGEDVGVEADLDLSQLSDHEIEGLNELLGKLHNGNTG